MSIYINGDIRCGVNGYKTLILMQDGSVTDKVGRTIGKAIEVPPHGALKDADALWGKLKSERALKEHCPKSRSIIYDTGFLAGYRAAAQIASKMPTIIPADREEDGADA